jgi:hypothetical protein
MISVPIIVFVILCLSVVLNIFFIGVLGCIRRIDKKEYEMYLDEEYGKSNNSVEDKKD